ncbi:hypothetical protein GRS96_14145 [Rathayibacter sp. VKM Ac-2803]|uniref:hypothetical protein n=1 Tax=Rathayibacter sp. VKM Ac-2803 TaxID=2609256 RepID=UPI00135CC021|nr:hypothetical protein [Rathayibacter sp. VKM Ac-2803]MWV50411.1 hypothetical protein [Rathayibacter sp. VKM Ac-2803]
MLGLEDTSSVPSVDEKEICAANGEEILEQEQPCLERTLRGLTPVSDSRFVKPDERIDDDCCAAESSDRPDERGMTPVHLGQNDHISPSRCPPESSDVPEHTRYPPRTAGLEDDMCNETPVIFQAPTNLTITWIRGIFDAVVENLHTPVAGVI